MLAWGDPLFWGVGYRWQFFQCSSLIPYLFPKPAESEQGRWFPKSNRIARYTVAAISIAIICRALTIIGSLMHKPIHRLIAAGSTLLLAALLHDYLHRSEPPSARCIVACPEQPDRVLRNLP